jgi:hypothetical protein
MLNHAAEEMIAGRVSIALSNEAAPRFYGHLIESLPVIEERGRAIAEVCLVEIAKQLTTDYPWVDAYHILNHEALLNCTNDAERASAVNALVQKGIIDNKVNRANRARREYRIRIPLVAIALRHDAELVEDEALVRLQSLR